MSAAAYVGPIGGNSDLSRDSILTKFHAAHSMGETIKEVSKKIIPEGEARELEEHIVQLFENAHDRLLAAIEK